MGDAPQAARAWTARAWLARETTCHQGAWGGSRGHQRSGVWLLGAKGHGGSPEPPCRAVQGLTRSGKDPTPTSPPHLGAANEQEGREEGGTPHERLPYVTPRGHRDTRRCSYCHRFPHSDVPTREPFSHALGSGTQGSGTWEGPCRSVARAEKPARSKPGASVDPQQEAQPAGSASPAPSLLRGSGFPAKVNSRAQVPAVDTETHHPDARWDEPATHLQTQPARGLPPSAPAGPAAFAPVASRPVLRHVNAEDFPPLASRLLRHRPWRYLCSDVAFVFY